MLLCGRAVLGPAASGGFGGMCPPTARAGISDGGTRATTAGQQAEPAATTQNPAPAAPAAEGGNRPASRGTGCEHEARGDDSTGRTSSGTRTQPNARATRGQTRGRTDGTHRTRPTPGTRPTTTTGPRTQYGRGDQPGGTSMPITWPQFPCPAIASWAAARRENRAREYAAPAPGPNTPGVGARGPPANEPRRADGQHSATRRRPRPSVGARFRPAAPQGAKRPEEPREEEQRGEHERE